MKELLERYLRGFPRDNEGGGGGAGGAGAGSPGGAGNAGAAGGEGGGAGAAGGSGDGAGAPPPELYVPEGLADNFKGKDNRETIDKLFGAVKGYRDRDAAKDVPEAPEGYLSMQGLDEKAFKADDRFKGHFDFMAKDPGMLAAAKVAKEAGISRPVFLNAVQHAMGALSEAGILEPMVDEAAERAALLPDTHKNATKADQDAAIDKRMGDNLAFVDLMVANGGLDKEAGEYAQLMLADSAKGHKFLEWLRGRVQGGDQGPGAHGGGGGGGDTAESLQAELQKPELTPGHPKFDKAKYADHEARFKAFHSKK